MDILDFAVAEIREVCEGRFNEYWSEKLLDGLPLRGPALLTGIPESIVTPGVESSRHCETSRRSLAK